MTSRTGMKDIITLRGSTAIVSEFFGYATNSILYNRGVYPEESFAKVKKYGLLMLLTEDEGVKSFITNLNAQLSENPEKTMLERCDGGRNVEENVTFGGLPCFVNTPSCLG